MGVRHGVVAAIIASWLIGDAAAADSTNSKWVVLKVSRVEAKPKKVDGTTWDSAGKPTTSGGCGLIGMVGTAVAGSMGGAVATFLCSQSGTAQQQRDPSAPDLFAQVVAGDAKYRTPIAPNTFGEAFDFPIVVPLEGIPAAGLQIQVLDQDDDIGAGELIGMVRLTKKQVQQALSADSPLLTLSDSQLERIEIEVIPYSAPPYAKTSTFAVNQEPTALPIKARAGELVTIAAKGKYSVADNKHQLDENGYTNGDKVGYNRKPDFVKANHAAAIASIGSFTETHTSLVVGSCVAAVAPHAGQIFVGVNDESVGNNDGSITFAGNIGLPTVNQWRSGGAYECPKSEGREAAPKAAVAADAPTAVDLPNTIDRAMISAAVGRVKADVVACGNTSSAKGQVKVAVTVTPDGNVASASVKSTPDTALGDCVAAALQKASFAKTQSGGSFTYPFVF